MEQRVCNAAAKLVFVMVALLAACGGGDDGGGSPEQRICTSLVDCGAIDASIFEDCMEAVEDVDGTRAKEECAACVEANTCGEVDDGACATDCQLIPKPIELSEEVLREICQKIIGCVAEMPATETQIQQCVTDNASVLTPAEVVECGDCLAGATCSNFEARCEAACGG